MSSSTLSLTISIPEVIYDIQNKTYLTGKAHADGANHQHVAQMQANNDDDNLNQILRSVETALANVRHELGEWLEGETLSAVNTTLPGASASIRMKLGFPTNFNLSALQSLADGIHQYLVAFAVSEWFGITNKNDAAQYSTLATEAMKMVRQALSERRRPLRQTAASDDPKPQQPGADDDDDGK